MKGFFEWLESVNEKDNRVRAVLRRSLAFEPGCFPPAYPYVEPFVKEDLSVSRRHMFYLAAGLWAGHWRAGRSGPPLGIGQASAIRQKTSGSEGTERRFIALLDADADQLPYRLRQMLALLGEQKIDFEALLKGLLHWNDDSKRTQNAWARDFYRNLYPEPETVDHSEREETV